MGVRPPTSDASDGPSTTEFGIAELDALIQDADLDYPVTASELLEELDDPEVAYDPGGHTVALSTALERIPRDAFDSRQDLLNALHPVFEDLRTSSTPGVVGWLRSLLPF